MEVVHGVDLRRGGVAPGEAEEGHPPLHLAEHEARLVAHRVGRGLARPHRALAVAAAPLLRLAASRR